MYDTCVSSGCIGSFFELQGADIDPRPFVLTRAARFGRGHRPGGCGAATEMEISSDDSK